MAAENVGKVIDILLVEDNLGDARLAEEALKDSKIKNKLYVVTDGEEASDFYLGKVNILLCLVPT